LVAMISLAAGTCARAMDWIALHEKADQITVQEALENVERNSESMKDLYVLGLVYLNQYETQSARQVFQKIKAQDASTVEARWGMAEVLRREHRYDESVPVLEALEKEYPDFAPALITLAYIHYIQRDYNGAVKLTGEVINMGQDNVDASNYLRAHGLYAAAKGMLAHYGGPFSKAVNGAAVLKHLHIIQKIRPGSPVVNFGLGSYYMLIPKILGRDLNKAEDYLQKTIEADPLFPDPYVRLAQIFRVRGDNKKYQDLLEKALQLDPANELALDIRSRECHFICLTD